VVEHLAGLSPTGDLLVFWWSPQADWQFVNVSDITGQRIEGPVTSWQSQNGPYLVEHLAGQSSTGDLLAFWWSPEADWQFVNVSAITGQKIAGPVTSWVTRNVEQLAAAGPNQKLYVFWWTPSTDWRVVNVTEDNMESPGTRNISESVLRSWPAITPNYYFPTPGREVTLIVDGFYLGGASDYPDGWCFIGFEAHARYGSLAASIGGGFVCKPGRLFRYGWPPGLVGPGPSPLPVPEPPRPLPPPPLSSKYQNWGTTNESTFVNAGVSTAKDALKATQADTDVVRNQKERGALIFEYMGLVFTTPLTEGESFFTGQMQGAASVSIPKLFDTLPAVDGITVTGLVHSHPQGLGFSGKEDPDVQAAQFLFGKTSWMRPDGRRYKMDVAAMFISAPEGGRVYRPNQEDPDRDFARYDIRNF
jgi:hypothetical protein